MIDIHCNHKAFAVYYFIIKWLLCSPERATFLLLPCPIPKSALLCFRERIPKMYDYDIISQVSSHVEAVLLLTKLNVERHIEVDVSMDELDMTAAESKATYDQIRDYVWEHHQLKVSNLYIAQVKQKHGIIERENYHKAKNENAKQPKCPKEKEDAIVEALRHFQMI